MEVGDIFESTKSGKFEIIKYESYRKIFCKFLDTGYITHACGGAIKKGYVKDLLAKTHLGVGITGVGEYTLKGNAKEYDLWRNMLARCYSEAYQINNKTYMGCTVDEDWLNFQNFCEGIKNLEGYPEWYKGEDYQLDKDLLQGNKVYSAKTCRFIPRLDNLLDSLDKRYGKNRYS